MAQSSTLISNCCGYLLHFTIAQNNSHIQIILQCFHLHHGIKWDQYGHSYCLEWENTNPNSMIAHTANNAIDCLTNTQHCYLVLVQQNDNESATCYLVRIHLIQQPILVPIRNWSISKFQCHQNIQIAILNGPKVCIINSTSIIVISHHHGQNNIQSIYQIPNPFLDLCPQQLSILHDHSALTTSRDDLPTTRIWQHASCTSIKFTPYDCFVQSVNSQSPFYAVGLIKTDHRQSNYKHCKLQSIALTPIENNSVANPNHTIIPDIYCNILTCFTLINDHHQIQAITKLYNDKDISCNDAESIVLACTKQSQLIEIYQMKLARLCKIPFNNAVDIVCIMVSISYIESSN